MIMNWMKLSATTKAARRTICMVVLVSLVLFLNVTDAHVMAQDVVEPGRFEEAECPMILPGDVNITCGYLSVPEVQSDASSRTIRLAVAILHSHSDQPQPDPVVHLQGGPGQGDLERSFGWLNSPYLAERDLILVDQRGVGFSEPALACPEVDQATVNSLIQGLSQEALIAGDVAGAAACRDQLLSQGVTLEAYNTLRIAADFEALRLTLGYEQWNLHGTSYGVLPTLTMMRLYPASIRSVTLEATMPLQPSVEESAMFGRALDEVFSGCANDAACNAAYPQLADQFQAAVDQLNSQPVMLHVQLASNGPLVDVPMDGQLFANILFLQLYSPPTIPYAPLMISQVAAGNGQVMTIPAQNTIAFLSGAAYTGQRLLVTCQDILPFAPPEDGTQTAVAYPYLAGVQLMTMWSIRQVCESWGIPAASADFAEPVNSDLPTLLLHGQFDPRRTTADDVQVAQTLPNSYRYIVPGVGHSAVQTSPCAQSIAATFVSDPSQEPATDCLAEVHGPAWILPGEVYVTPAMVNLVRSTMEPIKPLLVLLVLICLLIFIAALIGAVRGKTQARTIRWLSGLVALTGLVTLLTLIAIILATLTNGTLIGFGIPGTLALIRFLPLVAGAFAVALAVMVVLLWLRRFPGSTRSAIFTSALAIAGLFVSGWLLTLGFLP
jgi:pimeloyl-ACP methyl ester carboxylesterase